MQCPYVIEISYQDPSKIAAFFSKQTNTIFLDSAQLREHCGRYSYVAVDPFATLICKNLADDPFQILAAELAKFPLERYPDLPPFQGGAAGFFSYDLVHHLEVLNRAEDDMAFPDLALGLYDLVISFDELLKKSWIFSSGYPEKNAAQRHKRAQERMTWLQGLLLEVPELPSVSQVVCDENAIQQYFSADTYQAAVKKVIDYILAGDIFEANISQRFSTSFPADLSPFDLYRRLRLINPAPFSAYLHIGETIIASASPERFLKLTERAVESRPIKGTRPRGKTSEEDKLLAQELMQSEKDHAENVMIVDLLRNDLSRVCDDHSVQVTQLCEIESYAAVHHLVSVITGKLQKKYGAVDLLRATFPGGSITGAPKVRAMEIINEIEPTARGPYCGSIGFIGFNGEMDSSIVIRTFLIKNNIVTFQAGGAVTLDSNPVEEYEETLTKARALRRALTQV